MYLYDASIIECVAGSMLQRPREAALIVSGYINSNTAYLEGNRRGEAITVALLYAVLYEMSGHFRPCQIPWARYGQTWTILRQGMNVYSWMDYIIRT